MKKQFYEQPTCNLLVIRFEQGILVVSGGANYAKKAGGAGGDDIYSDSEDF